MPSIIGQTERFYDLSGSVTYLSVTALSLYLPAARVRYAGFIAKSTASSPTVMGAVKALEGKGLNWRQVVVSAAVAVWATRRTSSSLAGAPYSHPLSSFLKAKLMNQIVGSFLFARVLGDGHDSRFDTIRAKPLKFFGAFFAQATWISLCLMPVLALNSIPAIRLTQALPGLTTTDILGLSLFAGGFIFEVVADRQKNKWVAEKKAKKHEEDFLTRGLWSRSRHPNYFGEITLWTGIAVTCWGALSSPVGLRAIRLGAGAAGKAAALGLSAISPIFVTFLLTKVSGIPLSEEKYDRRYGGRKDYDAWKENTPVLIPKLF